MFAKRTNWNLAPNALAEALAKHRAAGKPLIDLTVSNPTECGFTYESEVILEALRNAAALKYEPNARGLEVAREAVARYYADRGDRVAVDDIILTTSTSEAYSWVFRLLCDASDEVLVPAPSYPLLGFLADIQDVSLVRYPLFYDHGWHIDMHELERAITARTQAVVVVHPNNPTGNYCSPTEMRRLGKICAARGLALVADEVFLDFALDGVRRPSFVGSAGTGTEALTFTMSGISKICGLPQMKVAWLVTSGPAALKQEALARLEVIADTYLSMNAPIQLALGTLLGTRHGFQAQLLQRVRANLTELDRQVAAGSLGERLAVEGGWYAVVLTPRGGGGQDFELERLAADSVLMHPGHFYDFAGERHVVISLLVCEPDFTEGTEALLRP
jgi:aspartate/methionine/tyrosine aminotransferase